MDPQPLYDLSPLLRLMVTGAVIALGPLAWVWLRNRQGSPARRLQALTVLTLFLTFDLVLFGAFTRLTDSGLGCPDWPGCYGHASPSGASEQIGQAQAAMPTGPVTYRKAWIEMIHRYLATGVGALILMLAVASWYHSRRSRLPVNAWVPAATLVWVCVQGAFGALTVTMKLFPAIVTLHLLGGLLLLALLAWQAAAYRSAAEGLAPARVAPGTRTVLLVTFILVWVQVALGGWVSTNYAVLACSDFPTCQGSWWPVMDFRQGFEWWRELGRTGAGENIGFAALTAIHYAHRVMAILVLAALGLLAHRLARHGLALHARGLGALALWQLLTGLSNVVLGWPLLAAVGHTAGAAGLVLALTWAWCATRSRSAAPRPVPRTGPRELQA